MIEPQFIASKPAGEIRSVLLTAGTGLQRPSKEISFPVHKDTSALVEDFDSINCADGSAGSEIPAKDTVLVVHHLNNSRSQRLLWLIEELEIPYEIKKYERTEESRAPKELKEVHPLGKAPIITDGDVTLAESGAITEYIISKYGARFRPPEAGRIHDLYFTNYAEGSIMPILVKKLVFLTIFRQSPTMIQPLLKPVFATIEKNMLDPELKVHCALIESHLEKSKTGWLAGGDHPTSADFMMAFPIELLVLHAYAFSGPKTKEYIERIHQRPSYIRGIQKGGKYDYANL